MNFLSLSVGMPLVLAIVCLLLFWGLRTRSALAESRINMDDFLLGDDGKISTAKFVLLGSFGLNSWLMVYLALQNKMDHEYVYAFAGVYVTPAIAKIWKGPVPIMADTQRTVISQTTVTAPKDEAK